MPFSAEDRALLLAVKGVGPTVLARLEQMGLDQFSKLAKRNASDICSEAAGLAGSTCWKNSPQARKAIEAAIAAAQSALNNRK